MGLLPRVALGRAAVWHLLGSNRSVRRASLVPVDAQSPDPLCRGRPARSPVIGTRLHIDDRLAVVALDDAQFHGHAVGEPGFVSHHLGLGQARGGDAGAGHPLIQLLPGRWGGSDRGGVKEGESTGCERLGQLGH